MDLFQKHINIFNVFTLSKKKKEKKKLLAFYQNGCEVISIKARYRRSTAAYHKKNETFPFFLYLCCECSHLFLSIVMLMLISILMLVLGFMR